MQFFTVSVWMLSLEVDFVPFFYIAADTSLVWYALSLSVNLAVLF